MAAPVYRPKGVLAGTFGVGILTFLLLPSEVGYQDLVTLLAREVAIERVALQKPSIASAFGTIHAATLNLPQPVGTTTRPGHTLVGLDPNNVEITGSIRQRLLSESALLLAPGQAPYPMVDRRGKGDLLTSTTTAATARKGDNLALKGDRLDTQPQLADRSSPPAMAVPTVVPQVAEIQPSEPLSPTPPQPQVAQLDRAPETPQPAARSAAVQQVPETAERLQQAQPAPEAARPPERVQQAQQQPPQPEPTEAIPSKGFVLASAGDFRIGLSTNQFERPAATAPSRPESNKAEKGDRGDKPTGAEAAPEANGNAAPIESSLEFSAADDNPSLRAARLYFSIDPTGQKIGSIEPWAPGEAPRFDGANVAALPASPVAKSAPEFTGKPAPELTGKPAPETVKLAALPPVGAPEGQNVSKDQSAPGGLTVAPKGEVTGADKRPMTPAERLGLNDEKSRAKSEKCLTEVIYFEARGEQVRGQMAVAQVVLNRAFSGKYPPTVCGVVYQNSHRHLACQFTFSCDGIPDVVKEPDMWERAKVIASEMLDGKLWLPEVGKATHYHAHWVHPGWVREMTKLHRVGVHTFYRPRNWGDGGDAPQWGDVTATAESAKRLVEVAKKP